MPSILEALRGRMQQRQFNAFDTIAAAARAVARGERYDVAAIEKALADAGMSMADFETQVEKATKRAAWLIDFEQLANATAKAKKLEAAAEAERTKFEAIRQAYFERADALDAELRQVATVRDKARDARAQLLDPRGVPGTIGEKYREAVEAAHAADVEVADAQRAVREQAERIKAEQGWVEQLTGEGERQIQPSRISYRDPPRADSPGLEEHRNALARAERRKAEALAVLADAEKRAAQAQKVVDALVPEVLKA
jgi:hypothetical protein